MAENPFKIIGRELPKFLQEMGVPFLGKDKPRGSVMDPDPNAEKAVLENAFIAAASVLPASKLAGMILKSPVATGAGAVALTGDPLAAIPGKAGLAMFEGTKDAEAAFRNRETSSLSRKMIDMLMKGRNEQALDYAMRGDELPASLDLSLQAVANKLTAREMSKYGTPEFVLDRYLRSTKTLDGRVPPSYGTLNIKDVLNSPEASDIAMLNSGTASIPADAKGAKEAKKILDELILDKAATIEDFTKAQKEGKDLYTTNSEYYTETDIASGIRNMVNTARDLGIAEEQIAGKTLPALNSIILKEEDKAIKELQKNIQVKADIMATRTEELRSKNDSLLKGFVKLENDKDLAQETDALNHCVGAVGLDNNRWIPGYDTVTGKASKLSAEGSSMEERVNAMKDGDSIYSYRPDGIPQFTVQVGKGGNVKEAYAINNTPLNDEQNQLLQKLVKEQGWTDDFTAREAQFVDDLEEF